MTIKLIARITRLLIAEIRHLTHQQPYRHVTFFTKKKKKLNLVPRCVTFIVMRARTRLFTGPIFHIELRVRPNLFKVDWDVAIWAALPTAIFRRRHQQCRRGVLFTCLGLKVTWWFLCWLCTSPASLVGASLVREWVWAVAAGVGC